MASLNTQISLTLQIFVKFAIIWNGIFYLGLCAEEGKRGFLLTVPNTLYTNNIENLCLSLQNIAENGSIKVELLNNKEVIASTTHLIIQGRSTCFEFFIPITSITTGIVRVQGKFNGISYTISGEASVTIENVSTMTFIETDKQLYKPGQRVLFRIFRLTNKLIPVLDPVSEVWIDNPSAIRVAQWKVPQTVNGITDLSFELTNEPQLGKWFIRLKDEKRNVEVQSFTVKEYVLPKFKIEITTPNVLLINMKNFTCKVCAHYTYGQPVRGKLYVEIKWKLNRFRQYSEQNLLDHVTEDLFGVLNNGCHELTVDNIYFIEPGLHSFMSSFPSYTVHFSAIVTESGTEVKMNESKTQVVFDEPFRFEFNSKPYFKPGMPYYGKILVKHHDGSPAVNESIKLTIRPQDLWNNIYLSNDLGEVNFIIETERSFRTIHLAGSSILRPNLRQVSINQVLKSWYSPSQSFLQIEPHPGAIPCNAGTADFRVNLTIEDRARNDIIRLHYQVMARGKLLFQQENMASPETDIISENNLIIRSIILPLNILPQMSPLAQILVYYVKNDGEIVSDSQEITIAKCFLNEVNMSFDEAEILPGTSSSIQISAHPRSVCALNVVDKSAHVLSSNNLINIEKVFASVSKTYPKNVKASTLNRCPRRGFGYWYGGYGNLLGSSSETQEYTETDKAFRDAGLVTISDLHFRAPPCPPVFGPRLAMPYSPVALSVAFQPRNAQTSSSTALARYDTAGVGFIQTSQGAYSMANSKPVRPEPVRTAKNTDKPPTVFIEPAVEIRDYFPETWLWELHHIGVNGSVPVKRKIPHSISTWIGTVFCLSAEKGLGISQQSSIRAFHPFFLSVILPYSVKNGEVMPIIASIFNYLSECISVRIFLEESDKYTLIDNSSKVNACVCGQASYSHKFWIRPSSFGISNVTVHAHSINDNITKICDEDFANVIASDAITKPILVKAHGNPKEFSNTTWICPHEFPDQTISQEYFLSLPRDVIKGSERAFVSVIGDLMGPTIQGLESLVKLPVGCGEQNMVLFAPNVYVIQYLNNSNQLSEDIKQKAIDHLKSGYQRQLNYRHRDGSYSAFGGKDSSGSIWLTAFVIKSFAQAKPLIYINSEELDTSIQFIQKNQMNNGCFRATGVVLSKSMQGGLGRRASDQSLAAYIIIALLEAGVNPTADIVTRAFQCLTHGKAKQNNYLLAMQAYAAALAKREDLSVSYLRQLYRHATRKGDMLYWTNSDSSHSLAVDIEITSYALLALVTRNSPESKSDALSIVRWLTKQRNSHGGFVSTQDTILALQAIAKYASLVNFGNTSMEVILEAHEMEEFSFQVTDDNKLLLQTKKIPILPTHLEVTGVGVGCAMVQVTMKYNVMDNGPMDAFHLDIQTSPSSICSMNRIDICTRYLLADGRSNMAVIEIQMISGFEADANSLDELQNDVNVQLKRWEISPEGSINLYFEELTNVKKCFGFNIVEKILVQKRKPAIVKVYDYYEPELSVSQNYTSNRNASCDELVPVLEVDGNIY